MPRKELIALKKFIPRNEFANAFNSLDEKSRVDIVAYLLHNFIKGILSDEENAVLQAWKALSERNEKLFSRLTSPEYLEKTSKINLQEQWAKVVEMSEQGANQS